MRTKLPIAYLAIVVLGSVLASLLAPYSPTATDLDNVLSGPTLAHPFGTDGLGRDVLSRLMYGGQVSLVNAAIVVLTVLVVGVASGIAAGFLDGWLDRAFNWVVDMMLAIPVIVTLLVVLAVFQGNQLAVMIALGILVSPGLARVTRGATLAVREELFVAAARVCGLRNRDIVIRHVLPRVAGPITVQMSVLAGGALLIDAGLSYLGFGAQPPDPTWGNMIAEASTVIDRQPWLLVPPGVVLGLAILAFGVLGDAIRDATAERTRRIPARSHRRARRPAVAGPVPAAMLSIEDVAVDLSGTTVVEGVSLYIDEGETVGLIGESGCGKTITGRAVLDLLPAGGDVPRGRIFFNGRDLLATDLHGLRGAQIAMISQDPIAALDPVFTVGQQVGELVRRHHGGSRAAVRSRVLELLRDVDLPDPVLVAGRYPHQLSGGMAQRVGIAMALAGEPGLLIADEPTTALDVTVQAEVLKLLRRLQSERGMAILLITHDWKVVADMCRRAYVMYAGHIVESGPVLDLMNRPAHPYTAGLLAARPQRGQRLKAIRGTVPEPSAWPSGCHFAPRCELATDECSEMPIAMFEPALGRRTRCLHHVKLSEGGQHERTSAGCP